MDVITYALGKRYTDEEVAKSTEFVKRSSNLFDISKCTQRTVISANGNLSPNNSYSISDFIRVKPATTYSLYGFINIAYYDKNKNFIRRDNISYAGSTITTGSNVHYIRLNFQPLSSYPERRVNEGPTLLPYEPFYTRFSDGFKMEPLNDVIDRYKDRVMFDMPIDGIFSTNETYADYTNFSSVTAAEVYTMFDNLMASYPDYITKQLLGNDAWGNPISAYYFTPAQPSADLTTKMPKVFITCGVHGHEHASTLVAYLFFKQMCEKWQEYLLLEALRFNVNFILIPVVNPSGWDAFTRTNANGVDINRNFPHDWVQGTEGTSTYSGTAPLSELESQYVMSIFNTHPDIDIVYDFHNFHESDGDYFLWIPTNAGAHVQHMAKNLISRMTRKWKNEYAFIPDNFFVGYTDEPNKVGMIQNYAQSIGIRYAATFEICWKWVLDTTSVPYDQTMCKTGVEAFTNWLLINLRELAR